MSVTAIKELSVAPHAAFPEEWYEVTAEGHFWLDWRFRAFQRQLEDLALPLDRPLRGLDVGCGHGVVRRQLESISAWTTDGADLHREGLLQNHTCRGETYFYNVLDQRAELAGHYDFAVLFDVIEHVEERGAFLGSVLHHVKPGGWLFLNVPALERLRSAFDEAVGHLKRYERDTLLAEIDGLGLEVRDLRYWGFAMLPYLVIRKLSSRGEQPVRRVIEKGVLPPAPWMDGWIRAIMRLETRWLRRPPLGTSLMLAAVRAPGAPG